MEAQNMNVRLRSRCANAYGVISWLAILQRQLQLYGNHSPDKRTLKQVFTTGSPRNLTEPNAANEERSIGSLTPQSNPGGAADR